MLAVDIHQRTATLERHRHLNTKLRRHRLRQVQQQHLRSMSVRIMAHQQHALAPALLRAPLRQTVYRSPGRIQVRMAPVHIRLQIRPLGPLVPRIDKHQ